jgi:leucyl/phenylalanyl-tRNA--protein transferase
VIRWLRPTDPPDAFPPASQALRDPDGLLCAGGDLSAERLLAAYRRGIFPWYGPGQPILWWSPDPRMVLVPSEFRTSRSLAKSVRNRGYAVRCDHDFGTVVDRCAASGTRLAEGTWLTAEMRRAYVELHRLGHAHSVEVWASADPAGARAAGAGEPPGPGHDDPPALLVGGLYGVRLGRVFFGESMFSLATDASKVALHWLASHAPGLGIELIDCQMETAHLASLGARSIPRREFVAWLRRAADAAR